MPRLFEKKASKEWWHQTMITPKLWWQWRLLKTYLLGLFIFLVIPFFFWFKYLPITSPIFIFKRKDYDLLGLLVDVKDIISGTRTITRIAYIWHGLYSLHKKDCLDGHCYILQNSLKSMAASTKNKSWHSLARKEVITKSCYIRLGEE